MRIYSTTLIAAQHGLPFRPPLLFSFHRLFDQFRRRFSRGATFAITDNAATMACCLSSDNSDGVARCRESFARRMALAGIRPHHRIALGVSGGPDSIALCVLAAEWKLSRSSSQEGQPSGFVDGMLAIVVDHGLRPESAEEAQMVCKRVMKMGINCEIASCEWPDGRPELGHIQEAARDMRYQTLVEVCVKQNMGILLIAHHCDDQAELFILRLSRNSGILGLAGMPFVSRIYPSTVRYHASSYVNHGILLVRPMLELSKEDMYKICKSSFQSWVEDPTNKCMLFARNRIRAALSSSLLEGSFRKELSSLMNACQLTRAYVESVSRVLINQSLTNMENGYGVIDLEKLKPLDVDDICLVQYLTHVLQFYSQRHKPLRGRSAELLLDYIRRIPCKTSLTVAGCYLSALPRSKGKKITVSCSPTSLQKSSFQILSPSLCHLHQESEVLQIVAEAVENSNKFLQTCTSIPLLDVKSSSDVLEKAKDHKFITTLSVEMLSYLQKVEYEKFHCSKENEKRKSESAFIEKSRYGDSLTLTISPGQMCHFMNRYLIAWNGTELLNEYTVPIEKRSCHMSNCTCEEGVLAIRLMVDADWLYLSHVSIGQEIGCSMDSVAAKSKNETCEGLFFKHRQLSAQNALKALKVIPVSARHALPVLVTTAGVVASIPSIGFRSCPCLSVTAKFCPRVPLGGGHAIFV